MKIKLETIYNDLPIIIIDSDKICAVELNIDNAKEGFIYFSNQFIRIKSSVNNKEELKKFGWE